MCKSTKLDQSWHWVSGFHQNSTTITIIAGVNERALYKLISRKAEPIVNLLVETLSGLNECHKKKSPEKKMDERIGCDKGGGRRGASWVLENRSKIEVGHPF
jgi:hypothetical protein